MKRTFVEFEGPDVAEPGSDARPRPAWPVWLMVLTGILAGIALGRLSAGTGRPVGMHAVKGSRTTSHDIQVPRPLERLVKLDFPDASTSTLTVMDAASAAPRQLHLITELARGLTVSVTAVSDRTGGSTLRIRLASVAVQRPGLAGFRCEWCGHSATPRAAAAHVTQQLQRTYPRLIALLGDGINCALRQAA